MSHRRIALVTVVMLPLAGRGQVVPTDAAGDPLPPGAVTRIGTVRFVPRPYLQQVFFTPDGKTILGRGGGDVIDLWEAETGKPVGEFRDPDLMNFWIDQSPDGKRLALYGHDRRGQPAPDTTLRVYDWATRKKLWESTDDQVYRPGNFRVRFSRDGKKLITGDGLDVRVWDAATGKELARHSVRVGYAGLVLSPDGKMVAFQNDNTGLAVWAWETADPPRVLPLNVRSYFNSLAFSADGKTIYTWGSGPVAMGYDVETGRYVSQADESVVRWRATSPDGKTVAVADYDKAKQEASVVLKDAATGKEVGRLRSGPYVISSGCWSKDGTRLAGTTAFKAWVWDVKTQKAFGPDVPGHKAAVTSLTFSSDGRLFTGSNDRTVRAWDPVTGKELLKLTTDPMWRPVALSPDGDLLAGSSEPNTVRVWDAKTGKELFKLAWSARRTGGVYAVRFTSDGQTLLTYGHDFYLRAFDTLTGKLRSERKFRPAALGPETDDEVGQFQPVGLSLTGRTVELGPDGNTLVLGLQKEVTVYAAETGKERFKFEGDPRQVESLIVSPDGKRLAVTGYGPPVPAAPGMVMNRPAPFPVTVWDLTQAKRLAQIVVPATSGWRVLAFTPDGKRLATGSSEDTAIRLWDAVTGAAIGVIELPRPPQHLAFGGDKLLAVGLGDPTVLVYDLAQAVKPVKNE